MTRPSRNPNYYSGSTDLRCPACSKLCKSKAGKVQHIRAKHGSISHYQSVSSDAAICDLEDDSPQTPVQSCQGSSHLIATLSRNGNQFKGIETPDATNFGFATSPAFGVFSYESYQFGRALNLF
jgi:hypothetical protein